MKSIRSLFLISAVLLATTVSLAQAAAPPPVSQTPSLEAATTDTAVSPVDLHLDTYGVLDTANGQATVGGTLRCAEESTAYVSATLTQRTGRKTVAEGSFHLGRPCSQTPTAFSVSVASYSDAPFVDGAGWYEASASTSDPSLSKATATATDQVTVLLAKR